MGKLSYAKANEYNQKCSNGFMFSVYDYVVRNERVLTKSVYLNEDQTERVQCEIFFGNKDIVVNYSYSKLNEEKTFWCGRGFGYTERIAYGKPRKMLNDLFEITKTIDDNKILAVWQEHKIKMSNF